MEGVNHGVLILTGVCSYMQDWVGKFDHFIFIDPKLLNVCEKSHANFPNDCAIWVFDHQVYFTVFKGLEEAKFFR